MCITSSQWGELLCIALLPKLILLSLLLVLGITQCTVLYRPILQVMNTQMVIIGVSLDMSIGVLEYTFVCRFSHFAMHFHTSS